MRRVSSKTDGSRAGMGHSCTRWSSLFRGLAAHVSAGSGGGNAERGVDPGHEGRALPRWKAMHERTRAALSEMALKRSSYARETHATLAAVENHACRTAPTDVLSGGRCPLGTLFFEFLCPLGSADRMERRQSAVCLLR